MDNHDEHDNSSTTHSFKCSVEGCPVNIEVHANDDEEAVQQIMMSAKVHSEEAHSDAPAVNPEEMKTVIKEKMVKH